MKSKILIIGGTGYLGRLIVEESVKSGHSTFAIVRGNTLSEPTKAKTIKNFRHCGVIVVQGDIGEHGTLVKVMKEVDVVISMVSATQILEQTKIISSIKEAGNIKRFLPSEFSTDVDHTDAAVEPAKSVFDAKIQIRRAIEAGGIPYTYVASNCFSHCFLPSFAQFHSRLTSPPTDKITIYGDGNAKVVLNKEEDIAAYTIKTVDDPRTLNRVLNIMPRANIYSLNELVALWENKIGKTLEKSYISEEQILRAIPEAPGKMKFAWAIIHSVFVKGEQTKFEIDPSSAAEASQLYPDVQYTSVEAYLDMLASKI